MFCHQCGANNNDDARFCQNCGVEISAEIQQEKEHYQGRIRRVKLFHCSNCRYLNPSDAINCGHCGIVSPSAKMVKRHRNNKLMFFVVLGFMILLGVNGRRLANSEPAGKDIATLNMSEMLMEATGCTAEQTEEIAEVLREIGIQEENIYNITHIGNLANGAKTYQIDNSIAAVLMSVWQDGVINEILTLQNGGYLYANNEILYRLSDFTVSSSEAANYKLHCENAIKSILKAPSTAVFPSIRDWNIWKYEGNMHLQAYVDSQNSFGAMIRSEFQFTIDRENNIVSLIFDGEEMIAQ